MHVFYLHGFASSAASTKAAFLAGRLAERGITLQTPDFNEPDFSTLTITRMIDQTITAIAALPPDRVVLIGSSLGAFVAIHVAARLSAETWDDADYEYFFEDSRDGRSQSPAPDRASGRPPIVPRREAWPRVDKLVLLAPAIGFAAPDEDLTLGDRTLKEWQTSGFTNVFHYGFGRVIPVGYDLYTDACRYDCTHTRLDLPILIFQGRQDTVVSPARVEAWARERPNVELHLVDDEHQLGASLDVIWAGIERFI